MQMCNQVLHISSICANSLAGSGCVRDCAEGAAAQLPQSLAPRHRRWPVWFIRYQDMWEQVQILFDKELQYHLPVSNRIQ